METLLLEPPEGSFDTELLRRLAEGHSPEEPCPPAEALASWAEGGGSRSRREAIEQHLAECTPCRECIVALQRAGIDRLDPPRSRSRRIFAYGLCAAALLVVAGFAWTRLSSSAETLDERFERAARRLAALDPDRFGGLPLPPAALRGDATSAWRGGSAEVRPSGVLLDTPRRFLWAAPPLAREWRCTLFDESGQELWTEIVSASELEWPASTPPLRAGTYVFEAVARGEAGEIWARGSFALASAALRGELELVRSALSEVDEPERGLLLAQWALREDLRELAIDLARSTWLRDPSSVAARSTLRAALLRYGSLDEARSLDQDTRAME